MGLRECGNPASDRGTAGHAGKDCPQAFHALRAIANAKQPNAPSGQKAGTLENNPAKSYKPHKDAANRTPKRRINAERVQLLDFCRFLTYIQMKTIMSMNYMTEAELKLADEKLRAEVAKLIAETRQIGVRTFLEPFLAAAGLMGATAVLTATLVKLLF